MTFGLLPQGRHEALNKEQKGNSEQKTENRNPKEMARLAPRR